MKLFRNILPLLLFVLWQPACVELKQNQLYIDTGNPNDTVFYKSSEIYVDYITSEAWATDLKRCVSIEAIPEAAYKGELGLHITWDRTSPGCPWLGIGFGWDNWTSKDFGRIKNIAAVEFYVKMVEGERDVLPWAIAFEDFAGSQAFLGLSPNAIKAEKVSTEWTRIELPLSEFDWGDQEANFSDVKQIIIQLEATGEVYLDELRIVPYSGGYRERANLSVLDTSDFIIDGDTTDAIWDTKPQLFGNNRIHLAIEGNDLCMAAMVKDPDPMQNSKTGAEIWDGDCIELAFSTDPKASQKRNLLLYSDQHIGFGIGEEILVYDWRRKRTISSIEKEAKRTADGYILEARIGLAKLGLQPLQPGFIYGLELAVDHGTWQGRLRQDTWSRPNSGDFYKNPSIWGELYIPTSQ